MTAATRRQMARVDAIAGRIESKIIGYRRDFHRYAESGWTEFRTASLVARRLARLGLEVQAGREVLREQDRMGLPSPDLLDAGWHRAVEQGGDRDYLDAVRGGFTGVVGSLRQGKGPVVALRFDIDALGLVESQSDGHRPVREGFASVNERVMHACGRDGHIAVGLGVAEVLSELRDGLAGTVKLVFQPAEEGVRGAKASWTTWTSCWACICSAAGNWASSTRAAAATWPLPNSMSRSRAHRLMPGAGPMKGRTRSWRRPRRSSTFTPYPVTRTA